MDKSIIKIKIKKIIQKFKKKIKKFKKKNIKN